VEATASERAASKCRRTGEPVSTGCGVGPPIDISWKAMRSVGVFQSQGADGLAAELKSTRRMSRCGESATDEKSSAT